MKDEEKYELVRIFNKPMKITFWVCGFIFLLIFNAIINQHQVPVPNFVYIVSLFIPFILIVIPIIANIVETDEIKARVKKDIIQKHKEKYAEYLKNRGRNRT